jgi:ribonuclease P protein component
MPVSNKKFTLGATERLKSRKTIERLFRDGRQFMLFPFKVYYLFSAGEENAPGPATPSGQAPSALQPPSASPIQAGFAAGSRHFKKAVDRNRIKRLTKEAYRLQRGGLQQHLQATHRSLSLFLVYTGKDLPAHALISEKIGVILQKLIKEAGS